MAQAAKPASRARASSAARWAASSGTSTVPSARTRSRASITRECSISGSTILPVEEPRPVLVAEPELLAEPLRRHQHHRLALALEQRVGRDRRPHLDARDVRGGDRRVGREPEKAADAVQRGVRVLLRVLRQELSPVQPAVRIPRDDVGEGPAPVDPEVPGQRIPPGRSAPEGPASGAGARARRGADKVEDPVNARKKLYCYNIIYLSDCPRADTAFCSHPRPGQNSSMWTTPCALFSAAITCGLIG